MEIKPAELSKEITAGRFRPVYYLLGEEAADKAAAVSRIKEKIKPDDFNFRAFSEDLEASVPDVLAEAGTLPVLAERRLVLVKSPSFPAAFKKALAGYLKEPCASTVLLLVSDERRADAKDALFQAAVRAGAVCLFSVLKDEEALSRLKAAAKTMGKTLSDEAAALLVRDAGTDWSVLKQELEKAALFSAAHPIGTNDVLQCLGYRKAADPFALARLIQERKLKESLAHLRWFLADGKPEDQSFRALAQMSSAVQKQLRAKIMLRAKTPPTEIFQALRLHSYWDRDFLAGLSRWSEKRLAADLKLCLKTETALKSKSWLKPAMEIEGLTIALCRKGGA